MVRAVIRRGGAIALPCPWSDFTQAAAEFCEASHCAWIRQPGNTWTNVGFLVAAVAIWRGTRGPELRHLRAMAWILVVMGLGSAFYHATETRLGLWLDWTGMYAMTGFMGAFALGRALRVGVAGRTVLLAALVGIGLFSLSLPRSPAREVFVLANLLCPATEGFLALRTETRSPSYRWFFAAYLALAPAVVLSALDQRGSLCDPHNHVLSGHGAWHLLDALMFWCSFRYYAQLPR